MDRFIITGGTPLRGTVGVHGAKNAALPLLAATILTDQPVVLRNSPALGDIRTMCRLLIHMGGDIRSDRQSRILAKAGGTPTTAQFASPAASLPACSPLRPPSKCTLHVQCAGIERPEAPYEVVKTMRASSMVLGPLLARCGRARVSLPGGCAIGARPLGLHLQALEKMGAKFVIESGYIVGEAKQLRGVDFTFDTVTVTGTENVMMAATLAQGTTTLRNAAREPEIVDLATCLRTMGACIAGDGTSKITITGVARLGGADHTIIPDRIETGTYMIGAAMTGGDVCIQSAVAPHVEALTEKLRAAGATISIHDGSVRVIGPQRLTSTDCTTAPFPGFATDLQAQFLAAMTTAIGNSIIVETVFENRFMHVGELQRLGADITVNGNTAIVKGTKRLRGAPVMATDLRASASLVLAGLIADGTTEIQRVYHIDRGYERIEEKLRGLGAKIERV